MIQGITGTVRLAHAQVRKKTDEKGLNHSYVPVAHADIDECLEGTHSCGEENNCRNTVGSYMCCGDGYRLNDRCIGNLEFYNLSYSIIIICRC